MDFEDLIPKNASGGISFDDLTPKGPAYSDALNNEGTRATQAFGEGVVTGGTYGGATLKDGNISFGRGPKLDNPQIVAPTPAPERIARRAGEFLGEGVAITGLGKLAEGAVAAAPAIAEYSPMVINTIKGLLTGAMHEGVKGSVQGNDPVETLKKMGVSAATFGLMEGPFASLVSSLASVLRETPEAMAQRFASPSSNIAKRHFDETGETYGKTLLDNKDVTEGNARDVFQQSGGTLKRPNPQVNNAVNDIETQVQQEISSLNQRPGQAEVFGPDRQMSDKALPAPQPAPAPETLPKNDRVFQPKAQSPDLRDSGEVLHVGEAPAQTTQPYGAKYDTMVNPYNKTTFEGVTYPSSGRFEPNPDVFTAEQMKAKAAEDAASAEIGQGAGSREEALQRFRQEKMTQMGPHVDMEEVAAPVRQEIQRLRTIQGPDSRKADQMEQVLNDFLANKPRFQNMGDTVNLRRDLDSITNKYYRSNPAREVTETAPEEEVNLLISNALRGKVREISPKLAALFDRQHFLLRTQDSLAPQMAGIGRKTVGAGLWTDVKNVLSNNLGTARAVEGLSNTVDAAGRAGVPEAAGRSAETSFSKLIEDRRRNERGGN